MEEIENCFKIVPFSENELKDFGKKLKICKHDRNFFSSQKIAYFDIKTGIHTIILKIQKNNQYNNFALLNQLIFEDNIPFVQHPIFQKEDFVWINSLEHLNEEKEFQKFEEYVKENESNPRVLKRILLQLFLLFEFLYSTKKIYLELNIENLWISKTRNNNPHLIIPFEELIKMKISVDPLSPQDILLNMMNEIKLEMDFEKDIIQYLIENRLQLELEINKFLSWNIIQKERIKICAQKYFCDCGMIFENQENKDHKFIKIEKMEMNTKDDEIIISENNPIQQLDSNQNPIFKMININEDIIYIPYEEGIHFSANKITRSVNNKESKQELRKWRDFEGGFGYVYKGQRLLKDDKYKIAIKMCKYSEKTIEREFSTWDIIVEAQNISEYKSGSANIALLYFSFQINDIPFFVFQFETLTLKEKNKFEIEEFLFLCLQLFDALDWIHNLEIIHCDISPQNVLLQYAIKVKTNIQFYFPLLTDFGVSVKKGETASFGNKNYHAPEQMSQKEIEDNNLKVENNLADEKTDTFALCKVLSGLVINPKTENIYNLFLNGCNPEIEKTKRPSIQELREEIIKELSKIEDYKKKEILLDTCLKELFKRNKKLKEIWNEPNNEDFDNKMVSISKYQNFYWDDIKNWNEKDENSDDFINDPRHQIGNIEILALLSIEYNPPLIKRMVLNNPKFLFVVLQEIFKKFCSRKSYFLVKELSDLFPQVYSQNNEYYESNESREFFELFDLLFLHENENYKGLVENCKEYWIKNFLKLRSDQVMISKMTENETLDKNFLLVTLCESQVPSFEIIKLFDGKCNEKSKKTAFGSLLDLVTRENKEKIKNIAQHLLTQQILKEMKKYQIVFSQKIELDSFEPKILYLVSLNEVVNQIRVNLNSSQRNNLVGFTSFLDLIKNNKNLKFLSLIQVELDDKECEHLSKIINTISLERLDIQKNNIKENGCKYLSKSLRSNSSIKYIKFLDNDKIGDEGCRHLSKIFQRKTSLKYFEFVRFGELGNEMFKHFLDSLQQSNTLKNFLIKNEVIGVEKCRLLSQFLNENTTLNFFNISSSNIRVEECKILSQFLKKNTSLKDLDISNNKFGDNGLEYLSQNLRFNSTLKRLSIEINNISNFGCEILCRSLQSNSSLQYLNISGNSIDDNGLKYFLEMLDFNFSLTEIIIGGFFSDKLLMKKIKYYSSCNEIWSVENHSSNLPKFQNGVRCFLLVVKLFNKNHFRLNNKIPKMIVHEIFKKIDRRVYFAEN